MKKKNIKYIQCLYLVGMLLIIGCSTDQKIEAEQVETTEGAIDTKLVGKWAGVITGDLGNEDITLTLEKTGSISSESATGLYCTFKGTWEVLGKNFEASGEDDCNGSIISFTAPNSSTSLIGTWGAANGDSGTFSVNKE